MENIIWTLIGLTVFFVAAPMLWVLYIDRD